MGMTGTSIRILWAFLLQPVWIPGRNREPRKHTRLALFVLDSMRFGSTFAMIFMLLFISLNYQSFWEIVRARLDPSWQILHERELTETLQGTLKEKLRRTPLLVTAGRADGDLLSVLPPVGPPDNRIIIPKLNLNVPIVIPPFDALLAEDWERLESDIQQSLQHGVVHYPGTARPGQAGNFFVTGHSSYYPWAPGKYKTVFARLPTLDVGDEYWVYYGGDRHRYIIQSKEEVRPSNVGVLDQPIDRRISTLMTCTPVGTTLRRLILTALEVDPVTGLALAVGEHEHREALPKVKMEMLPI
jgi:LPXTG-site transpeptidase (sortase) family protein